MAAKKAKAKSAKPAVDPKTKRVILVWEQIPESTSVYDLELTESEFKKITKCHGCYVNANSEASAVLELNWLSTYIEHVKPVTICPGATKAYAPRAHFDAVIVTGFVL